MPDELQFHLSNHLSGSEYAYLSGLNVSIYMPPITKSSQEGWGLVQD